MSSDSMAVPGGTLHVLDGHAAAAREPELTAVHGGIAGSGDAGFARRLGVWGRQPGFVLVEARHGGYVVGYAVGLPLRPSTDWWRDLTSPVSAAITAEHPGRTFALTQLMVRASWRRQGIATELHDLVMGVRAQERATVKLPPGAAAAQAAFRNWGWTRVARARGLSPSAPILDVLTRPLASRTA